MRRLAYFEPIELELSGEVHGAARGTPSVVKPMGLCL